MIQLPNRSPYQKLNCLVSEIQGAVERSPQASASSYLKGEPTTPLQRALVAAQQETTKNTHPHQNLQIYIPRQICPTLAHTSNLFAPYSLVCIPCSFELLTLHSNLWDPCVLR